MQTVNIHEAKTHLSRLIVQAQQGAPFVIAKSGKPVVIVSAIPAASDMAKKRFGFLSGTMQVPDDFDHMGDAVIAGLFAGGEVSSSWSTPIYCYGRPMNQRNSPPKQWP